MPTGTSRDVAADMERIFAPLAGRAGPRRRAVPPASAAAPGRGRSRAVMAVVAPLGVLAAVTIGYNLGTVPDVRPPQSDPAVARAARPAVAPPPVAQLAIAEPASALAPVSEPEAEPDALPSVDAMPSAPPPPVARPDLRPRVASRPARAVAAPRDEARGDDRCTDDECLYRDVLAADRRLRRAYDRAARAGVSSDWLAGVNRRWVRARDRAQDDPDGAIDRYDQLAEALDNERRELSR